MVERIRTLLESREFTPTQFADAIGVARPIISHILSGRNKPSLEVVQRILAAMPDLAMPWLLNGSGPMLNDSESVISPAREAVDTTTETEGSDKAASKDNPKILPLDGFKADAKTELRASTANIVGKAQAALVAPDIVLPHAAKLSVNVPKRFATSRLKINDGPIETSEATTSIQASAVASAPIPVPTSLPTPEVPARPIPSPSPVSIPDNATADTALPAALSVGGGKPIRRIVIFYRDGSFADYQPE